MSKADIFSNRQTKVLIDWVASQYGERLEFLWERLPDCAVWRHAGNQLWYAVLMRVSRHKITGQGNDKVDVLDLRYQRELLPDFVRHQKGVYPGWHMNKDNWISVILDETLTTDNIKTLIDNSREIAGSKK